MTKTSEKKKCQLGEDAGTASSKLRKSVLFKYVKLAGHNFCHQCGFEIENESNFSIEHKVPWLDSSDPSNLFYDLDNVAFSHLECNVRAARRKYCECGTMCKYNKGCRCENCTRANREKASKTRAKKKAAVSQLGEL